MSKTYDLNKMAEKIVEIIRQRSADATVTVETSHGSFAPREVFATWKRGGLPEVGLHVRFERRDDDRGYEASVSQTHGTCASFTSFEAVTFGRLISDVATIGCEIEALTKGMVFTAPAR